VCLFNLRYKILSIVTSIKWYWKESENHFNKLCYDYDYDYVLNTVVIYIVKFSSDVLYDSFTILLCNCSIMLFSWQVYELVWASKKDELFRIKDHTVGHYAVSHRYYKNSLNTLEPQVPRPRHSMQWLHDYDIDTLVVRNVELLKRNGRQLS